MYQITQYPEFSWSLSRDKVFKECQRKYYYQYYGGHNGWINGSSPHTQEIYKLKHILSTPQVSGQIIHSFAQESIIKAIKKGSPPATDYLKTNMHQKIGLIFNQTKDISLWSKFPKSIKMLHEHYYGTGLETVYNQALSTLETCAYNLANSETFKNINSKTLVLENDDNFRYFMFHGYKIFVRIDLLYQNAEFTTIHDWKSSKIPNLDKNQLSLYSIYVNDTYNISFENMKFYLEYLLAGQKFEITLYPEDIEMTKNYILYSINQMEQYLEDKEINKPLPEDVFTKSQYAAGCKYCKFYQLCNS